MNNKRVGVGQEFTQVWISIGPLLGVLGVQETPGRTGIISSKTTVYRSFFSYIDGPHSLKCLLKSHNSIQIIQHSS